MYLHVRSTLQKEIQQTQVASPGILCLNSASRRRPSTCCLPWRQYLPSWAAPLAQVRAKSYFGVNSVLYHSSLFSLSLLLHLWLPSHFFSRLKSGSLSYMYIRLLPHCQSGKRWSLASGNMQYISFLSPVASDETITLLNKSLQVRVRAYIQYSLRLRAKQHRSLYR